MFSRFITWSIIVPVSIAFGCVLAFAAPAIYPPSSSIAWPIACPGGEVTVESQNYSYKPGQSGVARTVWCQHPDGGTRSDVTMKTLGILFLIYTLLAALALRYLVLPWIRRRLTGAMSSSASAASPGREDAAPFHGLVDNIIAQARAAGATVHVSGTSDGSAADAAERLSALKAMLDQGLISRDDYEAKKADILSGL